MRGKGDLSDFKCVIAVCTRQAVQCATYPDLKLLQHKAVPVSQEQEELRLQFTWTHQIGQ